jgi:peptide/nickel transport system permease protein
LPEKNLRDYIIKKVILAGLIILGVTIGTFLLLFLAKDPATTLLPPEATAQDIERLRETMGLNDPLIIQTARFVWSVAKLDLGISYLNKQPVTVLILERVPASFELTFAAFILYVCFSLPIGMISAIRRFSWIDNIATSLSLVGQAMPIFWLGIMLIMIFGIKLHVLPISGRGGPLNLILPSVTLGAFLMPLGMRLTRSAMIDALSQDYIRTAKSKGLSVFAIYFKHAAKNAILPVITAIFVQMGVLLSGAVVTETVFAWPGLGRLATTAIMAGDYPLVRALVLLFTIFVVTANLVGDVIIAYLDPRVRLK